MIGGIARAGSRSSTSVAACGDADLRPGAPKSGVYDQLYREFRAIYKQNRAMYRRLNT